MLVLDERLELPENAGELREPKSELPLSVRSTVLRGQFQPLVVEKGPQPRSWVRGALADELRGLKARCGSGE